MVYGLANEIARKKVNRSSLVKDENGNVLLDPKKVDERWASHFENILNRPPHHHRETVPDILFLQIDGSADPPSTLEVEAAIKTLRWPYMVGRITAEMLKTSLWACLNLWNALLVAVWSMGKVPRDWTRGILVKLFKKGDTLNCNNWSGINLTSVPSKLLARIILRHLREALYSHIRKEQLGFRPGISCFDLIFIPWLNVKESREWNKKLCLLFSWFWKSIRLHWSWCFTEKFGILSST